ALAMYERGVSTGVNKTNREMITDGCSCGTLSKAMQELMLDPQTSGGLLVSIDAGDAEAAITALHDNGVTSARIIGEVAEYDGQWMRFTAS
ncbi:MAG: hypothetical protein HUJ31_05220, partial [Pseudomonadales bacterium]|nr:hypothetical protein [Pseudomonadales bacterium]